MSRSLLYFPSKVTASPESSRRTIVEVFLHSSGALAGRNTLVVEFCGPVSQANSEVESAGGDDVERRGVLGDTDGVVQRQ